MIICAINDAEKILIFSVKDSSFVHMNDTPLMAIAPNQVVY